MNRNLAVSIAIATLAIVNPLGKIPILSGLPGGEPIRPEVTPSLVANALLEKTIFKVDVVALERWLGPATTLEIRRNLTADTDSLAAAVAGSGHGWAQLVGLGRAIGDIPVWILCEPYRSHLAVAGLAALGPFGLHDVSWHDGRVSVQAGFRGRELA